MTPKNFSRDGPKFFFIRHHKYVAEGLATSVATDVAAQATSAGAPPHQDQQDRQLNVDKYNENKVPQETKKQKDAASENKPVLAVGCRVKVHSLTKAHELNGIFVLLFDLFVVQKELIHHWLDRNCG